MVILAGMKRVYGREIRIELSGDGPCFDRRFRQEPSILVMRRTVVAPAELRPDAENRSRIFLAQQAPSDDDEFTSMDREDLTLDCCVAALECPGWPGIGSEPCTELIAGWMQRRDSSWRRVGRIARRDRATLQPDSPARTVRPAACAQSARARDIGEYWLRRRRRMRIRHGRSSRAIRDSMPGRDPGNLLWRPPYIASRRSY